MTLKKAALLLTILGSIDWGLIGAFKFDLLNLLLFLPILIPVVQIIIGIAACYVLFIYVIK